MAAVPITLLETLAGSDSTRLSERSSAESPSADVARQRDYEHSVLLQLSMCGALIDRDAIEFARGMAEIMIWSAEHARNAAEARRAIAGRELLEWQCRRCGESVPGNFEICWQCERAREE